MTTMAGSICLSSTVMSIPKSSRSLRKRTTTTQHTVPQRGRRKIQGDVRADRLEPPGQFLIVPQELSGAPFQFTDHRISNRAATRTLFLLRPPPGTTP